jgi:hypothetical protein
MGAATSLLHTPRDPLIDGMVLDSPFSDLRQLIDEIVEVRCTVVCPWWPRVCLMAPAAIPGSDGCNSPILGDRLGGSNGTEFRVEALRVS